MARVSHVRREQRVSVDRPSHGPPENYCRRVEPRPDTRCALEWAGDKPTMKKNQYDGSRKLSRRDFGRASVGLVGVALGTQLLPASAFGAHHEGGEGREPELVSDVAGNQLLLSQVKFVAASEIDGKNCGNCALLLQREGEYGKCGLFAQGQVPVGGWCTSWILKPGT